MQSPSSAADSGTEMQALPARPTVKKTYGKPKTDGATLFQGDVSFSSDLTSLSQLSQLPPSSSAPMKQAAQRLSPGGSDSEDDNIADAREIGDSGYYAPQKSVKEMLLELDKAFDAVPDGAPELSKILSPVKDADDQAAFGNKRERVTSGASSSSTNEVHPINNQGLTSTSSPQRVTIHQSSPPTSPRSHAVEAHSSDEEEKTELPIQSRKPIRHHRNIVESDDEDSDLEVSAHAERASSSSHKLAQSQAQRNSMIEEVKENINFSDDSEDELPSVKDAGKTRKARVSTQSDEEEDIETQKTEAIEQYDDSNVYQSNRRSESPDAKTKSRKPRPPSKKDEEEAHRIAEQSRRRRHASIMPRSKPARPLSEISQRLQGTEHGKAPSSMRPSMPHRPRSSSTRPALSLRAASVPFSGMPTSTRTQAKPIEIGSSSAIYGFDMDEDSYDPSYLKAEPETQSQDSLTAEHAKKSTVPSKSTTSPIYDAEEDSDEELPDAIKILQERQEREKKAKALRAKKAALLARQQERLEKKAEEDVKGKGREIVMDLDSDPEDLEIEVTRASTPVIKADHHSPRSHKLMRQLAHKSVKKEHDDDMSESQFKRAGRTFHLGETNVVVNPHVAMKAPRAKAAKKGEHAVTTHGVYNLLIEKAKQQAVYDRVKRMEDWKRRGGTLRHDYAAGEVMQAGDEDEQDERAKALMSAIQARAVEATEGDEDDDGDDEDYVGSDDEAAILSGEDEGSAAGEEEDTAQPDSEEEEDEDLKIANGRFVPDDKLAHRASEDPDMSAEMSSIATTQVIPSEKSDASDAESEEAIVVVRGPKITKRVAVEEEESQEVNTLPANSESQGHAIEGSAQPTQYHQFVVKGGAPAFPEFGNEIKDISLTQAFGKVGATQAPPQASKAVFDDGDGFSQLFDDGDAGSFTQATEPTQAVKPAEADAPMPSMFRKGSDSSPAVHRHAFGEAPMLLDAALRDAQIREEAERAYDQIQFDRSRLDGQRQETDLTRTPGSTVSDEMPPLPPVSMIADRYSERGRSADDMSSDGGSDGSIRMEDINSPSVPRKLRRAGDDDGSRSPERPRNAFDALKLGQMKHRYGQDKEKKQRAKKSDFIAEEVEESEDEGEYSMLRKIHEEGDEEDGSDLDATVEELVDDEKGDPDEEEAQDEIVDEHHRDWIAQQEAKELKMAAKVAAGKTKKRRRGDDGGLSDSDYEDDAMHRTAKARKAKKYSTKMEALTANPETQSFAQAGMDDGTADINGDFLEAPDPTSEAASDEEYASELEDLPPNRSSRRYIDQTHVRQYETQIIDQAVYGVPSSPRQEVWIEDSLTVITSRATIQKKSGMDCFDDIDLTYAETQTMKRRVVQLEREESQNENGRGPGRTSAVTNFVRRQGRDTAAPASRTERPSTSVSTKKMEKQGSRPTLESGNRGRLAAARQSKR